MLAIAALVMLSAQSSEIVLREPRYPNSVHTTITAKCGAHEVSIRMENTQLRVGTRVTEIVIGDDTLSDRALDRLAAAIGKRDIVSANVGTCEGEPNLDDVSIVFRIAEHPAYSYTFVDIEITGDGVKISRS